MKTKRQQLGMSLIEVMVSVTILVLGLVGLAALQARSLMMNQSTYYRSIAADLAANLGERIRANRSPFLGDGVTGNPQPALAPDFSTATCPVAGATVTCAAQATDHQAYMVQTELTQWNGALRAQLPGASYTLTKVTASSAGRYRYTLTITWLDNRSTATTADQSSSYSVVIE